MTLRLIVAGTRDAVFADIPVILAAIKRWIARNGKPTHIVCGGNCGDKEETTLGVDLIGAHLALKAGVKIDFLPADWTRGGTVECDNSAGPERNSDMLSAADGLVVCRHEWSKGSRDVLRKAQRKWGAGSPLIEDVAIGKRAVATVRPRYETKAERKKWVSG